MAKSVQKNLRITPELDGRLKAAASRLGLSESELLRRGIDAVCVGGSGLLGATREASGTDARPAPASPAPASRRSSQRAEPAVRPRGTSTDLSGPEPSSTVDLAVWLAGRTGQPRSLVRRDIARGVVRVRGEVVTAGRVEGPLAHGDVTVAGEPV